MTAVETLHARERQELGMIEKVEHNERWIASGRPQSVDSRI